MPDDARRECFPWISVIPLSGLDGEAGRKKCGFSRAEFMPPEEGLRVQCTASGKKRGDVRDISPLRRHYEMNLNDAGKGSPEKGKTVIRYPVRKRQEV